MGKLVRLKFKQGNEYHELSGCNIDFELKENTYTILVRTKQSSGKLVRSYKVLSSVMDSYIDELKSDENTRIIEVKYI